MSRRRKWTRRVVLGVVLVAIVGAIAVSLEPDPIPVETAEVVRGPLVVTVSGSGKTRMRDRYGVFAPATGELSRIALRAGDPVKSGEVIATIEPGVSQPLDARSRAEVAARLAASRAALAEAKRNVERARIARDLADREVERSEYLVKTKAAPARSLELAKADAETRAAELELANLAVERARLEANAVSVTLRKKPDEKKGKGVSQRVAVTAPATGVVLRVHKESAGPVQTGEPLIEIGDPKTLELVVDLPTQSALKVVPGARVTIDGTGDDKTRTGVVRNIEPGAYTKVTALGVEEQRVDVIVAFEKAPTDLGDGFAADAHIEVKKTKDVLKVPSGAVFREGEGFAVFAVKNNRCRLSRVEAKSRNADEVAVEGLDLGSIVVNHPSDKLKEGALVAVE